MHDDTTSNHDAPETPDEFEQRIALPPEGLVEISVRNSQGEVKIRATDRDDVLVQAVKTGGSGSRRYQQARLDVEEHEGRIRIRPQIPNNTGFVGFDFGSPKRQRERRRQGGPHFAFDVGPFGFAVGGEDVAFDITVEIPRVAPGTSPAPRIDVRTASGDIELDGVAGQIGVTTASGDIELQDPNGALTVTTASGDVRVTDVTGSVAIRSASGDARISGGTLTGFGLTSASGDVSITADLTGSGRYHAESVSGDVQLDLGLPAAAEGGEPWATLDFKTVSGDAAVDRPFRQVGRKTWHSGPGDDGGVRIAVKNVSGDLRLTSHAAGTMPANAPTEPIGAVPPIPPAPPLPPTPPAAFGGFVADTVREAMDAARAEMGAAFAETRRAMAEARRAMGDADWPEDEQPERRAASEPEAPPPATASAPTEPVSTHPAAAGDTEQPETASATEHGAQAAEPNEQDRLAVLQALERGEIDIEEALNRLDEES